MAREKLALVRATSCARALSSHSVVPTCSDDAGAHRRPSAARVVDAGARDGHGTTRTPFLAAANLAFVLDELRLTLIRRARVSLLDEHRRAPMYDLPLQPSPNRMLCCSSCARWLGPTLHARDWMYHAPARNEVRVQLYGWLVAARAASSALCSHPVARGALGGVCVRLARVRGVACDFSKCSIETT